MANLVLEPKSWAAAPRTPERGAQPESEEKPEGWCLYLPSVHADGDLAIYVALAQQA